MLEKSRIFFTGQYNHLRMLKETYLDTLEMYITSKTYNGGREYIEKYNNKILEAGTIRDKIVYLF